MPEIMSNKVAVKNICETRDFVLDPAYGTGRWERGQVKLVDLIVGQKLIRHVDVFGPVAEQEAVEQSGIVTALSIDAAEAERLRKEAEAALQDEERLRLEAEATQREKEAAAAREAAENAQAMRDAINKMGRDQVIEMAATQYKLQIKGNVSVETARRELIQHMDMAGPAA